MRTAGSDIDIARASSLTEALRLMRDEQRMPIAGATDLYVTANLETLTTRRLVDIWGVPELREISLRIDSLVIGAVVTFADIIGSPQVAVRLPMLVEAARLVGRPQIQNRGTIGGNIASAIGDSLPILAAVDATIVVRDLTGQRRVPLMSFYTSDCSTVMRADELIVAVEVPHVDGRQFFRKREIDAATPKVAIAGIRGPRPRVAIGGVAPTVRRARETEQSLVESGDIDAAAATLERELSHVDELASTRDDRQRVAVDLLRQFWNETASAARGDSDSRHPL